MEKIDLPYLGDEFLNKLRTLSNQVAKDEDSLRRRFRSCAKHKTKNIVAQDYYYLNDDKQYLDSIYKPILKEDIVYYIVVLRNISGEPSVFARHNDEVRQAGINYYIDLGGDNVITKFYNPDPVDYVAESNTWYLFNGSVEHEVIGVTSTRLIFGMDLESCPDYEDLRRRLL